MREDDTLEIGDIIERGVAPHDRWIFMEDYLECVTPHPNYPVGYRTATLLRSYAVPWGWRLVDDFDAFVVSTRYRNRLQITAEL